MCRYHLSCFWIFHIILINFILANFFKNGESVCNPPIATHVYTMPLCLYSEEAIYAMSVNIVFY